jgi:restriction endonuclease S subunit
MIRAWSSEVLVSPWSTSVEVMTKAERFDPEFFDPRVESVSAALGARGSQPLAQWISSVSRGVSPEYVLEQEVPVIKTGNVRRYHLSSEPRQYVSKQFASENPKAIVPTGSLIITSTGVGSAGRSFLKLERPRMIADGHITVVRLADPREGPFICAFLQSPIGVQQLLRFRRGSSRQIEIYPEDIVSLAVPEVRKKARQEISRLWTEAVAAVQAASGAVAEAEQRIASRLGPALVSTAPATPIWELSVGALTQSHRIDAEFVSPPVQDLRNRISKAGSVPLSSLVLEVKKGLQPESYADDGQTTVIKSKDVHYPGFDLSQCDTTPESNWPYFLSGGELLINMTGVGTLGRATVVPKDAAGVGGLIPSVDVAVLTLDRTSVLPEYVALYLNSSLGRRLTTSLQTGSSGQQHLYPAHFSEIPILLPVARGGKPDIEWQRRTIEVAERRRRALDAARETGAMLDRLFLGELGVSVDLGTIPT